MENNSYDSWVKQGENEKEELKIEVIWSTTSRFDDGVETIIMMIVIVIIMIYVKWDCVAYLLRDAVELFAILLYV
jgi:hypothetical protein